MNDVYRSLCADLIDALDSGISAREICNSSLVDRVRAALDLPVEEYVPCSELELKNKRNTPADASNQLISVNPQFLTDLCNSLIATVKPDGGYEECDANSIGQQLVDDVWMVPYYGSDSLNVTLDTIKEEITQVIASKFPFVSPALTPATAWQPINTFFNDPKSTHVILYRPSWKNLVNIDGIDVAYWCDDKDAKNPHPYWQSKFCYIAKEQMRNHLPTHWQPFPSPPH